MNAKQDPYIQDILKNNPAAPGMDAAAQAHIAEHVAFSYRQQMEKTLGIPLPPPNEELDKEQEFMLAKLIGEGAQQLTQQKQAAAAQQAAQQKAQDPVFQMQQQELELKQGELQRKAAKDAMDGALD